jgi:uncharacterized iron-regulated membrane protein
MQLLKKCVILAHRYLGIAISALVIMWFVSGMVMMYAGGMPRITPQLRLERTPELDLASVRLSPAEAVERARAAREATTTGTPGAGQPRRGPGPGRVQLTTFMDRPAYRMGSTTVFADTGEVLRGVSRTDAQRLVARFVGVEERQVDHVGTLTSVDQWTLGQDRSMPLDKFQIDDADGTEVYLQAASGDITTMTTSRGRLLAWIGVIPHWLYFTALRENQPLWYRLVVWTSAAACALSVLGLILSVTQFRRVRPFKLSKAIPYSGWMRWHYITGAVFGIFTLTWAFSGLLSMEPFEWTTATGLEVRRDAFTGGPTDLAQFAALDAPTWGRVLNGRAIKEVEFTRIQDQHYYVVRQAPLDTGQVQRQERLHQPYYVTGRADQDRALVDAATLAVRTQPFSRDSLLARLDAALPDERIVESELLTEYDSYYYSRGRQTPLPVLRVKYADTAETWLYIDPEMSQILASLPRLGRVERWLYNGFHSLDFAFWYNQRPLWDIGMLTLLAGGLATSCFGLVMGIRRLRRGAAKVGAAVATQPDRPSPAAAMRTRTD